MYEYLNEGTGTTNIVGSFVDDKQVDFKNGVRGLLESFKGSYSIDPVSEIQKVLTIDSMKEDYKNQLIGDVLSESFSDSSMAMLPAKLEQLFENTSVEMVRESSVGQLSPIVGLSLPILKKNFLEGHAKDIIMTEVPSKPIVKTAFERKFLKDKQGNKHYIPEIFYNDDYKQVMGLAKGKPITDAFYPVSGTLPIQDLDVLSLSGGSLQTRDSLGYGFSIQAIKIEVGTREDSEIQTVEGLNITPDMTTGTFSYRVKAAPAAGGAAVEDIITGHVEFYSGKVSVASTAGRVTQVQFGGRLSNQNNTESLELDREREIIEWIIPDGHRLNTGLTIEKIKDQKALFNIDVTTEVIADMSETLTQVEDSEALAFLDDSFNKWKNKKDLPFGYQDGFVESFEFDLIPPSNIMVTPSQWIGTELKYNLNREIDILKEKLKTPDIMFVIYGNPANITLIQDDVRWVIDENTKVGGIQLDYQFGVMTTNKNRIHVVSSMKVSRDKGIRIVAYPLSKEVITFKHLKYSLNIENIYRNPNTPLVPNVMATSRFITTEVLPVQGELKLKNAGFGRQSL